MRLDRDAAGNASALCTALSVTTNACLPAGIDLVVTDMYPPMLTF